MGIVAVAGGTSGLGRSVVESLIASGKHEAIVLSRTEKTELAAELGVPIIVVDYGSVEALQSVLEAHNVDTVIDTINSITDIGPELNLIKAADQSHTTRRIIPSIFAGFTYPIKYKDTSFPAKAKATLIDEAAKTSLQYTALYNGYFLDFYGSPAYKSYVQPVPLFLDIAHDAAAIPGTGDQLIAFLHTTDLANFVVASLDRLQWPEETFVVGEKVTWNQFVRLVEQAKGTKFNIVHDSKEDLKTGKITQLPSYKELLPEYPQEVVDGIVSTSGLWFAEGEMDIKVNHTLNEEFPEIPVTNIKEFVQKAWGQKD